ncbi:protein of unknown function [Candidatus Nitrosotalea okcheonensis]|uniref:Uncharacterized protein n=1 Tax=Candidatus Nitrosotalea okcheonensis TaxID=1903276 RepID=A0A2H1FDT2_9ARCH|nr:protein of unknown function [Candidatus Nitrosotalea okcheonensis]
MVKEKEQEKRRDEIGQTPNKH